LIGFAFRVSGYGFDAFQKPETRNQFERSDGRDMKPIHKTLKWLGAACLVLLLALGAAFGLLQTTVGKGLVVRWIGEAVSGPGGRVTLGKVQGVLPFDVRIDRMVLADKAGDWFQVDGFAFRISAAQLLRGRFQVSEILAREVRLERLPQTGEVERKDGVSWQVPSVPGIRVERVQLDEIYVGAPILGKAMTFSAGGRLESLAAERSIEGSFQVKRTDGPVGEASLSWTVSGNPAILSLDLTASEDAGGVVASALDLAEGGALRLTLKGTAPIADWTGDLKASVAHFGALDCRVAWMLDDGFKMRADGVVQPHESYLARPPWDLLGREARFGAEVQLGSGEPLIVRRGSVTGDHVSLEVSGRLEEGSGAVNGTFYFALNRLDVLSGSGMDLAGSLRGEGKVSGTLGRPKLDLDLTGSSGVRAGDFSAEEMVLHLEGQVSEGDPDESMAWGLKGHGRVQGLRVADAPDLPDGGPVALDFEAVGFPGGVIGVKGFHLANRDLKVTLTGEVDLGPGPIPSFRGKIEGDLYDLSRYSALLGAELGGKTGFSADVAVKGDSLVSAAIKGEMRAFTCDLPILTDLAEKGFRYRGVLTIAEEGKHFALSGLEIDSGRVKVAGDGEADLHAGETSGLFQVTVPDLSFLSGPLGTGIAGALSGRVQIRGATSAPVFTADITMETIDLSGFALEKVAASIQTETLDPDLSGTLAMEALREGRAFKLRSRYTVNQDWLSLEGISLSGPGLEAAGQVKSAWADLVLEGDMSAEIEASGLLSEVLGQALEGKARLEVSAKGGPKGQDLQFSVSAPEVVTAYGKAKGLTGAGLIHDLFGHVAGEAKIKLETFEREDIRVKGLALTADGDLDAVRFEGSAGGALGKEPFDLKAGGKWAASADGSVLEMNRFEGGFAGYDVALKRGTRLKLVDQGFILEKSELMLDKSVLSAEGRAGQGGVMLNARFEQIPLEAIPIPGLPHLAGSGSGAVRISGRIEAPEVKLDLEIKGVRAADKDLEHLPEAAIRGSAQVKDGTFSSRVVVEGVSEKPMVANFKAPVAFSLSPLAFSLERGGAMAGGLDAEVKLETLASYFSFEGQRAEGVLKAVLSLSGSPGSPRLRGSLGLEGGAYDHLGLGLLLRDVDFQLALVDDRVEITAFRATDGEKGRIDLKGQATLGGDQPVHFELTGRLDAFKAVRQDIMTVTAAGPFAVKGSTAFIDVSGDLTLAPVEIRVPEQFPPEVVSLDVIEVHGGKSDETMKQTEESPAFPVTLDLKMQMPDRLFLRGRGLDSEWGGRLRIKGPARSPAVRGRLSVVRGTANVLGKVFKLTSGSVVFDGGFPPSPRLEMVAENKAADMTARIRASGSPSAFDFKLESEPPLPSDEILSRVLFGKSTTQISPFQALSLAQSISELSGRKSIGVFDRTRQVLGLDQLGLTQSESAQGGTSVSVGKYVSDKVYLQAEKTVTGEGGKVGVAVDVTRNIKLDTEAGADSAEVGVIWQWDY
jgi:translocation and assembly module TamB